MKMICSQHQTEVCVGFVPLLVWTEKVIARVRRSLHVCDTSGCIYAVFDLGNFFLYSCTSSVCFHPSCQQMTILRVDAMSNT